jgi:hypothetical protein
VGSRTAPVEEVLRHGYNGLLVDFFSTPQIISSIVGALADPGAFQEIRKNARQTILDSYDLHSICLPAHLHLYRQAIQPPASALWWRGNA